MKAIRLALAALAFILPVAGASTQPIQPGAIDVIDGDTIRASGITYRLVGFDTPETGSRARCEAERKLGAEATARLRRIVAGGGLELRRVACACPPGTVEGTQSCNYGRLCAVLSAGGIDVAATMIGARLARPFVCAEQRCPRPEPWCSPT